jgi:hypothetical protein
LPGKSDEEVLQIAGLDDGDIERMWTPNSVKHARLELFVSYLLALLALNFAIGVIPRASGNENAKTPEAPKPIEPSA